MAITRLSALEAGWMSCAQSQMAATALPGSRSTPSSPTQSCATAQYDVVQMTLVDTWASTAAGAFALSENSLYTTQAFREYFEHLKPDGIVAVTRWEFQEPREALRVVSVVVQALHELGVADTRG